MVETPDPIPCSRLSITSLENDDTVSGRVISFGNESDNWLIHISIIHSSE